MAKAQDAPKAEDKQVKPEQTSAGDGEIKTPAEGDTVQGNGEALPPIEQNSSANPAADPQPKGDKPGLPPAPVVPSVAKPFKGRCADCKNYAGCIEYQEINGKNTAIDVCLKDRGLL